jgi:hypothetical protein
MPCPPLVRVNTNSIKISLLVTAVSHIRHFIPMTSCCYICAQFRLFFWKKVCGRTVFFSISPTIRFLSFLKNGHKIRTFSKNTRYAFRSTPTQ